MGTAIEHHFQGLRNSERLNLKARDGQVDELTTWEEATRRRSQPKNQPGLQIVSSSDLGNGTTQHIIELPLRSVGNRPRTTAALDLHSSSPRNKLTQKGAFDPSNVAAGMLVLSRQRDESIIIGDNIVITVVDIRGDKVRLGINAPTEMPIHRQEVYEAIHRENQRLAGSGPDNSTNPGGSDKFPKGAKP